ncbi:hypothetical protein D3C76_758830 [compost metagenome]
MREKLVRRSVEQLRLMDRHPDLVGQVQGEQAVEIPAHHHQVRSAIHQVPAGIRVLMLYAVIGKQHSVDHRLANAQGLHILQIVLYHQALRVRVVAIAVQRLAQLVDIAHHVLALPSPARRRLQPLLSPMQARTGAAPGIAATEHALSVEHYGFHLRGKGFTPSARGEGRIFDQGVGDGLAGLIRLFDIAPEQVQRAVNTHGLRLFAPDHRFARHPVDTSARRKAGRCAFGIFQPLDFGHPSRQPLIGLRCRRLRVVVQGCGNDKAIALGIDHVSVPRALGI